MIDDQGYNMDKDDLILPPIPTGEELESEQLANNIQLIESESGSYTRIGLFMMKSANQTIIDASKQADPNNLFLGLWYESELCCLFADSFVGKSVYAVQIGTAIASSEMVLYFDFELSEKMFQLRYTDDNGNLYKFPDSFYRLSVDPSQIQTGEDFEAVVIKNIEEAALGVQAKIIIVDNLTWLCEASEKGEAATALMKDLWSLTRSHAWSILVLAHTPKRNLSSPITQNDLAGSKRLFNFFDSCFAIGKSARDESERYIKQLKVRSGMLQYHSDHVMVCRIMKTGSFTHFEHSGYANEKELLKDTESEEEKRLRNDIYDLADEGLSYQAIADKLGTNKSKVYRVMQKRKN